MLQTITTERKTFNQAILDEVRDMQNLQRHAQFVETSAIVRNLQRLLDLSREANAADYAARTPHQIAG